jgi:iron complex transport system ATP-binding protein
MGANGAGKTTLLKIFAGLLAPQAGQVRLMGRPLSACSRRELARSIALVPQEVSISVDFTVLQFVRQGRAPYLSFLGVLQEPDRIAVWKALALAGVEHLAQRPFNELSGGERQRVKIALALAQEPQLLLLDEPAQHLDIGRQAEVFSVLERLNQQGITIMAAVHDLESACRHFIQGILLRAGSSPIVGAPVEILTPSAIQEVFDLAEAQQNQVSPRRLGVTEKNQDLKSVG